MKNFSAHSYQIECIDFIKENLNAALWAEPGLGKTVITLTVISDLLRDMVVKGVLIVAPLRVARLTWPIEIEKWSHTKWLRYQLLHGKNKETKLYLPGEVFIINYEGLLWLFELLRRIKPELWPFDMVVWDESTKMKAHNTRRFRLAKKRIPHFKRRLALTGTPAANSLMDLWGQFYILDNGLRLGTSYIGFRNRFFEQLDYNGYKWGPRRGTKKEIKRLISDITMRVGNDKLLELHQPKIVDVDLELPVSCRQSYRSLEKDLFATLDDIWIEVFNAAAVTGKCLQFAGGAVYYEENVWTEVHRVKLEALSRVLATHPNEPILVIYFFRHEAERLIREFPEAVYWKSGLSNKREQEILSAWNNKEIRMLVGHPASLGHGLNLQFGGRIGVWFTLNWSLELYIQTNKRLDRQGQVEPPLFYRFIMNGTVDEVVAETLRSKDAQQSSILRALQKYRDSKNGKKTKEHRNLAASSF